MMFRTAKKSDDRLGDDARDARRWEEARLYYERAVEANPNADHIWVQLGHARKELGDFKGAEAAYNRSLALKPGIPDTHLQLGHLMKVAGRLKDAVKAYADASLLDPELYDAIHELKSLGYSQTGMRVFDVVFSAPLSAKRVYDLVKVEALAKLQGIDSYEVLQLAAHDGLRMGFRVHCGSSVSLATHKGFATFEAADRESLRCIFSFSKAAFSDRSLVLLYINPQYENIGSFDKWGHSGVWMAVATNRLDLSGTYLSLAAG